MAREEFARANVPALLAAPSRHARADLTVDAKIMSSLGKRNCHDEAAGRW